MTIEELKTKYQDILRAYDEAGMTSEPMMALVVPGRPPTGERKRVFPGVMGEVLNYTEQGTTVRVKLSAIAKFLRKVSPNPRCPACTMGEPLHQLCILR